MPCRYALVERLERILTTCFRIGCDLQLHFDKPEQVLGILVSIGVVSRMNGLAHPWTKVTTVACLLNHGVTKNHA